MWLFRELARLLIRIAAGAAIAALIAGVLALASRGSFVHSLRIMFFVFGALLLLMAGAGNRQTASHRRTTGSLPMSVANLFPTWLLGGRLSPDAASRPDVPTLTASAVFVASGAVLIALGFVV